MTKLINAIATWWRRRRVDRRAELRLRALAELNQQRNGLH